MKEETKDKIARVLFFTALICFVLPVGATLCLLEVIYRQGKIFLASMTALVLAVGMYVLYRLCLWWEESFPGRFRQELQEIKKIAHQWDEEIKTKQAGSKCNNCQDCAYAWRCLDWLKGSRWFNVINP